MAAEGSSQLRDLLPIDVEREKLSIEREISRLLSEQNTLKKEGRGIEKRIFDDLKREADSIERIGKAQVDLQNQVLRYQQEHLTTNDDKRRQDIEGILKETKLTMHQLDVEKDMARMRYDAKREEYSIEKEILQLNQAKLEKTQDFLGKFNDIFKVQKKYYGVLRDSVGLVGENLVLWSSIAAIIESTFGMFKQVDEGLAKFRMYMGATRIDLFRISKDILNIATQFTSIGVTIEGTVEATKALANEFGGTIKISKDLVETTAILKSQLGVAEDITSGFLRNMGVLSKTTVQTQRSMAFIAYQMTAAAGVPLHLVMQDVAKMSGNALAMVSRMPFEIVKAATAARQMGTTLNKIAEGSRQILNFTENVQAEMEASVLVGQGINLQLARELAYRRDIIGSTKAILAEARRIDFENLDVFQMEAFAAATGRSTDELLRMIQAQRQLEAARNIDGLRDEVLTMERLKASNEAYFKDKNLQTELSIKQMANQERMVALQNQWNQLTAEATRVLYPVFDLGLKVAIVFIKMLPTLSMITVGFKSIGELLVATGVYVGSLSSKLNKVGLVILKLSEPFTFLGNLFSKMFLGLGNLISGISLLSKPLQFLKAFSFALPFLKAVPVIGWVINGIQFIYNLIRRTRELNPTGWWDGVLKGIRSIGPALWDTLIQPFVDIKNYIVHWWKGHSPSRIGQMMIDGLVMAGDGLKNALIMPFKGFLSWIGSFSLTNIFKSMTTGIGSVITGLVGILTTPFRSFFSWLNEASPFSGLISKTSVVLSNLSSMLIGIITAPFKSLFTFDFTPLIQPISEMTTVLKTSVVQISKVAKSLQGVTEVDFNSILNPLKDLSEMIHTLASGDVSKLGSNILNSISGLQPILFDLLILPFQKFMEWTSNNLKIGAVNIDDFSSSVVSSLISIQPRVFEALTTPFNEFQSWVSTFKFSTDAFISSTGNIGQSIVAGLVGIQGLIHDTLLTPFQQVQVWLHNNTFTPVIDVTPLHSSLLSSVVGSKSEIFDQLVAPYQQLNMWLSNNVFRPTVDVSQIEISLANSIFGNQNDIFNQLIFPFQQLNTWIENNAISPMVDMSRVGPDYLNSITSVQGSVFAQLVAPFQQINSWLQSNSIVPSLSDSISADTSKIGESIVGNIVGIQSVVFNALTTPFQQFIEWVQTKLPDTMGVVSSKIKTSFESFSPDPILIEKRVRVVETDPFTIQPETIPVIRPSPEATPIVATEDRQKSKQDSVTLNQILNAINILNANLVNGKIAVNLDGQLVSATLARQTSFRGGYGTNNINIL